MAEPAFEFETLKGLVAAGREREGTALAVADRPAPYSYRELCTNAWKAANLLGHYGVHSVGELAVEVGLKTTETEEHSPTNPVQNRRGELDAAEPLLAVLGGAILGASVDLTPEEPVDTPVLVAPADWDIGRTKSCTRLSYGGPPTDPAVAHFERSVWSENPIEPPERVDPGDEALKFDGETWTHEELLAVVTDLVDDHDIAADSRVVLAADLTEPGGFVAGVLAPLAVGATVVVPGSRPAADLDGAARNEETGDVVVTAENVGESHLPASDVTRSMRDVRRV